MVLFRIGSLFLAQVGRVGESVVKFEVNSGIKRIQRHVAKHLWRPRLGFLVASSSTQRLGSRLAQFSITSSYVAGENELEVPRNGVGSSPLDWSSTSRRLRPVSGGMSSRIVRSGTTSLVASSLACFRAVKVSAFRPLSLVRDGGVGESVADDRKCQRFRGSAR